jgi:hypothetical protein
VRDSGTPYLRSKWPTDLTGRHFYDCGVYAVETAYDLFCAIHNVWGLTLEFKFLTFLNHLCMIAHFGDHSFLVNNALITPPAKNEDIISSKKRVKTITLTKVQEKIVTAFSLGKRAFATVYNVTYAMFIAVLPPLSVDTNRSEVTFKADIWKLYLNSQGWGISNQEDVARHYFDNIQLFNKDSIRLAFMIMKLRKLPGNQKETVELWKEATKIALDLHDLGESMTQRSNFVFFNKALTNAKPAARVGFNVREDEISKATNTTETLPMYELNEMLKKRKRNGQTLTLEQEKLIQRKIGDDHVSELSDRLESPKVRP